MSPPDVYLTSTFGYCFLNPSITAWNDVCSSPAQIAIIESEPLTSSFPPELLLVAVAAASAGGGSECQGDGQRR